MALTRWALAQPEVRLVVADTSHDNVASQAVMMRAGFRHVGDDRELRYYEAGGDDAARQGKP